jgi:hypothetical protein
MPEVLSAGKYILSSSVGPRLEAIDKPIGDQMVGGN